MISANIVFSDYSLNSSGHECVKPMTEKMPEYSGGLVDEEGNLAGLECEVYEAVAFVHGMTSE